MLSLISSRLAPLPRIAFVVADRSRRSSTSTTSQGRNPDYRQSIIGCRGPRDTGPNIAPPWAVRSAGLDPLSGKPHPDRFVPNTASRRRAEAPGLLARAVAAQVLPRSCANTVHHPAADSAAPDLRAATHPRD